MSSKTTKKKSAASPAGSSEKEKKIKIPKQFIVRPAPKIQLQPEIAEALELPKNSFVQLRSEGGGAVVAVSGISEDVESNVVGVPAPLRRLAGFLLGDRITISKYTKQPPYAAQVDVLVQKDGETEGSCEKPSESGPSSELATSAIKKALNEYGVLQPGLLFSLKGHTVTIADISADVTTKLSSLSLEDSFELVSPVFLINQATSVCLVEATPTSKYRIPKPFTFSQVGGLDKAVSLLRSAVQLPLHHPTLFSDFGISPPRGILLHGPPGTGKTMLLRCVAHECNAHVLMVNGPLIVSKYLGETENALRDLFAEAVKYQPAIIFMDEIDSLAPKRGLEDAGETESRVVATLLTMMDGMANSGRVVVVGATNRPNAIDPALRRPGRFDQEVEVGIPDADARHQILVKQLAQMNEEKCNLLESDVREVALKTHGYVGADLAALCREGAMRAISRGVGGSLAAANFDQIDPATKVEYADLDGALVDVRPSAMREIFLEMPKVSWDDIAGQADLKQKLTEVVQLPLEAGDTFARLGISAPKGVLLYGPPGCSKTLTAKALATESGLNFLAVKGPEIFNKYVGESERTIREIFRKARAAAPSIIFFDEIDALASSREEALTLAAQHVLTTLLNEIDGVEELNGVVIVAATNRPSEIDPALLRPGRLDRHIYVAPPDRDARLQLIARRCAKFDVENADALFSRLADATEGCSGAEVALLCQEAGLAAIMEDKTATSVLERHFDHAVKGISRGITEEMTEYYREFSGRSGLAM